MRYQGIYIVRDKMLAIVVRPWVVGKIEIARWFYSLVEISGYQILSNSWVTPVLKPFMQKSKLFFFGQN